MQTIAFARHLQTIVERLCVKEIVTFLENFLRVDLNLAIGEGQKNKFAALVFQSREAYHTLSQHKERGQILDLMKFGDTYASPQLSRMLTAFNNANSSTAMHTVSNYALFAKFYESLSAIIKLQETTSHLLLEEKFAKVPSGEAILELQIMDYDGTGIDTTRMQNILASLASLHDHLSRLLGDKDSRLRIAFTDSGSDVLLALQGAKAIMDTAKVLFEQFWDKIRFRTLDNFDRKLESLSKGLKFVELVQEQVNKKAIDDETAGILKHSVLNEMTSLTGLGACLPALGVQERVDRRKLLLEKKGIKLLGTGKTEAS